MVPTREIEAVVAAGDESRDVALAAITAAPEPADSAAAIQRLVAGVTVRRTPAADWSSRRRQRPRRRWQRSSPEWRSCSIPPPHRRPPEKVHLGAFDHTPSAARPIAQKNCRAAPSRRPHTANQCNNAAIGEAFSASSPARRHRRPRIDPRPTVRPVSLPVVAASIGSRSSSETLPAGECPHRHSGSGSLDRSCE